MLLTITTGVDFAARYPNEGIPVRTFTIAMRDQELNPEEVFHAGNQIEDTESDCRNLKHEWQRVLRRTLVKAESASISVGDVIEMRAGTVTEQGVWLGGWVVDRIGWKLLYEPSGSPVIIYADVEDEATL